MVATNGQEAGTEQPAASVPTVMEHPAPAEASFSTAPGFELLQRMAKLLAASELVPKEFQGKIANVVIALEMSRRLNASPLAVMQNLYIVHGKPSWSSQFIIAAINSTEKFSPLRFRLTGEPDSDARTCVAYAVEKATGEVLESPPVSIGMAKKEGWYGKNGSKWQTMPELMLRYRCATLFGRLYAPEVLMGMVATEEAIDITPEPEPDPLRSGLRDKLAARAGGGAKAETAAVSPAAQTPELIESKQPSPLAESAKPDPEALKRVNDLFDHLEATEPGSGTKALQSILGQDHLDNVSASALAECEKFLTAVAKQQAAAPECACPDAPAGKHEAGCATGRGKAKAPKGGQGDLPID